MNLSDRTKWFPDNRGTDGECGRSDGIGDLARTRNEQPRAGADDGSFAEYVRRFLRGGTAAEQRLATAKWAEKLHGFKDYIVAHMLEMPFST
jgi:hypothetical protein